MPWKNIFSFQELCTDPCDMGTCIITLKHEVMAVDDWQHNGPQDLVMVSLCNQIALDKMKLCSMSVAYACPYHNPCIMIMLSGGWIILAKEKCSLSGM